MSETTSNSKDIMEKETFSYDSLPFVKRSKQGLSHWEVEPTGYATGCMIGAEYAAAFLNYLKNGSNYSPNLVSIASSMKNESYSSSEDNDTRGHEVGFFYFLEEILQAASKDYDFEAHLAKKQDWHKNFLIRLAKEEAEDKKTRSDRARYAAMIRWHGSQAENIA